MYYTAVKYVGFSGKASDSFLEPTKEYLSSLVPSELAPDSRPSLTTEQLIEYVKANTSNEAELFKMRHLIVDNFSTLNE